MQNNYILGQLNKDLDWVYPVGSTTDTIVTTLIKDGKYNIIRSDLNVKILPDIRKIDLNEFAYKIKINKYGLVQETLTDKLTLEDLNLSDGESSIDSRYLRLQSEEPQEVTSSINMTGDLVVTGSITQLGDTSPSSNQYLSSNKDLLVLRANKNAALSDNEYTGIVAHNYNGSADGFLVFDNKGVARVGHNSLKPLVARDEAEDMVDGQFTYWNDSDWLVKTRYIKPSDINNGIENVSYYPTNNKDYATKEYVNDEVMGNAHYRIVNNRSDLSAITKYDGLRVFIIQEATL